MLKFKDEDAEAVMAKALGEEVAQRKKRHYGSSPAGNSGRSNEERWG